MRKRIIIAVIIPATIGISYSEEIAKIAGSKFVVEQHKGRAELQFGKNGT